MFIATDVEGEAGLAVRGLLCFGDSRPSALEHVDLAAPKTQGPGACQPFHKATDRPSFAEHFDSRLAGGARPRTPGAAPESLVWLKHRDDEAANRSLTGLVALADALPPPAMVLFSAARPISTMTWTLDLLADQPISRSGWWLVHSRADTARNGYSAQAMTVWNDRGEPAVAMRQTVAVFA